MSVMCEGVKGVHINGCTRVSDGRTFDSVRRSAAEHDETCGHKQQLAAGLRTFLDWSLFKSHHDQLS